MAEIKVPYSSLDTPVVLLEMDILEANIKEMSQLAAEVGVGLRPHVKIHESAFIAKMQNEAGTCGIEVGSVEQAEAMAEEGLDDIVITQPFYGEHKLEKFRRLLSKPELKLGVVVDMPEHVEGISRVGLETGRKVPVILKLETGGNRYGTLPGKPALEVAKKICQMPGIEFLGVYAHEVYAGTSAAGQYQAAFEVASVTTETANMLRREGIPVEHVSVGASPTFRSTCRLIREGKLSGITEIHPGSCVVGGMLQVARFAMTAEQCALTVLTSVMSTSHPGHAVIDAGGKTLGGDPLIAFYEAPGFFWEGKPSYGYVQGRSDLWLGAVHAECGRIFYKDAGEKLSLGERIEIVPNNPFVVINLHDRLYGVRKGKVETVIPVTGRGQGT
jgi:D-serine deaminase-like pyridoxal phosphate-dependent protein